jgi:phage terminase Nu1 subunit (DNA packaging protein)
LKPCDVARLLGVSRQALSKGCATGRLLRSVRRRDARGHVLDLDPDLAKVEWVANAQRLPAAERVAPAVLEERRAAAADLAHWNAEIAKVECERREAGVVKASEVREAAEVLVAITRRRLLQIPESIAARLPHLTAAEVGAIGVLVEDALAELTVENMSAVAGPRRNGA